MTAIDHVLTCGDFRSQTVEYEAINAVHRLNLQCCCFVVMATCIVVLGCWFRHLLLWEGWLCSGENLFIVTCCLQLQRFDGRRSVVL